MARLTYSIVFASVNASSCTAVAPASRMWYPEIDIGFQFGTSSAQKRNTSAMSAMLGPGG